MNFLRHYFNYIYIYKTFNRQTAQHCPIKCTSFASKWGDIALLWEFAQNGALATAETWHVKGHMVKINLQGLDKK